MIRHQKKKECDKDCSSCQKYQEKAFELEVDEELRQEQLNHFWKKYRFLICGGIFAVLALTAGIEIYRSWWMKVRLNESDIFEQGMVAAYSGKQDKAKEHFNRLIGSAKTGYRYLAGLELAGLALRNNETDIALTQLKSIMNSNAPKPLRFIATLSYVGTQFDTANANELLGLLQPVLNDSSFSAVATEMACALYMKLGQNDQANALISKALAQPDLPQNIRNKLETLRGMIENA